MKKQDITVPGEGPADARGQTPPPGGRDRSHDPQAVPQMPGGGGAPTTGAEEGAQPSEEAQNQADNGRRSAAESGTP